ncbi:MAG: ribosome-associated translation inhibitor RaiA [Ignavibacteria bacterium]|nr:ribosome-associated translation inhibitor RaiA [Ignavibacteria bacterium]MBL7991596.1 ribosome-associated translation inhibitor RaiA [Candidatus Kapabacteria bacterium]
MEIKVTARHFDAKPALREEAITFAQKFEKFYSNIISTEVILSFERMHDSVKIAEYIVHVQDHTLVAKESSEDFSKSLHEGAEKMIRQLNKLKTKQHVQL